MHHEFLGLYLDEWASLIAIGGGVGTALALIMRAVHQLQQLLERVLHPLLIKLTSTVGGE